jgi:hypothetical protein
MSTGNTGVEVDLFSGRANPTWELPEDLSDGLTREAALLPVIEKPEMFEGLGYRGFRVRFGLTETWRVQGEILEINLGGSITYKKNKSRSIENRLLESERPYLDEKIFRRLERDIREASI